MRKRSETSPGQGLRAAMIGGAAAAAAGALWGAHALARRQRASADAPLNPVMKTAITASELSNQVSSLAGKS